MRWGGGLSGGVLWCGGGGLGVCERWGGRNLRNCELREADSRDDEHGELRGLDGSSRRRRLRQQSDDRQRIRDRECEQPEEREEDACLAVVSTGKAQPVKPRGSGVRRRR